MKLFIIYRGYEQSQFRNSNGVSAALVLADDEADARAKAQAAARSGETKVRAEWSCSLLADAGSLPGGREVLFTGEVFTDARRQP